MTEGLSSVDEIDLLSVSEIIKNAKILLDSGEVELAASLFRRVRTDPLLGYLGHFGLGKCLVLMRRSELGIAAYEHAYRLRAKPFIALELTQTLVDQNLFPAAKEKALEYAKVFSHDQKYLDKFRLLFETSISRE